MKEANKSVLIYCPQQCQCYNVLRSSHQISWQCSTGAVEAACRARQPLTAQYAFPKVRYPNIVNPSL